MKQVEKRGASRNPAGGRFLKLIRKPASRHTNQPSELLLFGSGIRYHSELSEDHEAKKIVSAKYAATMHKS